ncbi:MAG: class I SAM-dependent methyltransferase [Candidatus Helarchaeota archaeon]
MKWKKKAAIMRACSRLPFGNKIYKWGQKRFGRLRADPMKRLPAQVKMACWLNEQGMGIENCTFFEVGTGHIPLVPIGFFLSGAGRIITVDLHRRIDWGLTRESLEWIALHRYEIESIYKGNIVSEDIFNERFEIIVKEWRTPERFLKKAHIVYLAPLDATNCPLPENSVNCHFSITTLEHIPEAVLRGIFSEARRILKPKGIAIHFVDLSDHFSHQDDTISSINFLKFSESEWNRLAGNEYAYCNRLRASDYFKIFSDLRFQVLRKEIEVDFKELHDLNKITLYKKFRHYEPKVICSNSLHIMLQSSCDE